MLQRFVIETKKKKKYCWLKSFICSFESIKVAGKKVSHKPIFVIHLQSMEELIWKW